MLIYQIDYWYIILVIYYNRIKAIVSEQKIWYNDSNIIELRENPKYYELKKELLAIPIILKNKNIIKWKSS